MAVYTQVSAEALSAFLERFDVGELVSAKGIAEGVENSNYLVDTTKSRFILTLYEKRVDQGDLPYFMALLDHCADRGLPVPPAVPDRNGMLIHALEGRPACLIQFLSGVSVSHPTPAQARAATEALGRMHKAVEDFPEDRPNSMGVDTWRPLFERCGTSLNEIAPGLYDEIGAALDRVTALWPREGFDRCAIHADLFPDNVLMLGNRVTGLIDFYFASTDLRLYDLAVMHTAWAFDSTGEKFDPYVSEALLQGYETSYKLSEKERAILPLLATGACIRFTLSRAWDWLNTPADALVTRKDPMAFWRRSHAYASALAALA